MKVFLSTDVEGTAGVADWEQCAGGRLSAPAGLSHTYGPDRLATYRAFCAAIVLTRSIAEAV